MGNHKIFSKKINEVKEMKPLCGPQDFGCPAERDIEIWNVSVSHVLLCIEKKLMREAKVVYCGVEGWTTDPSHPMKFTHQALLIGIEPIEKCDHPAEKVRRIDHKEYGNAEYICDCSVKVKPNSFMEIK